MNIVAKVIFNDDITQEVADRFVDLINEQLALLNVIAVIQVSSEDFESEDHHEPAS